MTLFLANRDPEPSEIGHPIDGDVYLEIMESDGTDVDDTSTQVYIEGVLAYDAGTFQTGFDGPNSASTSFATGVRRINIDPTTDFASEQSVDVRVVSQSVGGDTLDTVYSFTVEDFTAPGVLSVSALTPVTVQVIYNEPVKATDASADDDALNPSNYTLTASPPAGIPVVVPTVSSVSSLTDNIVLLTLSTDLTPGVDYTITITDVEDEFGNSIASPGVDSLFAFALPTPDGREFDLWRMIPLMNRLEDETGDLERFVRCLQEPTDLLLYDIDTWPEIMDPDLAPEAFVDAMLADLGNPFSFELSLNAKRRLLRVLVAMYKQKGLRRGIINVVRFFTGIEITITPYFGDTGMSLGESELGVDWELGPGDRALLYTFAINAPEALTDEERTQIETIAIYMKPAHTHLAAINEPEEPPAALDHWELGLSELGETSLLH